jgi:hypothetical protein
MFGKDLSWTTDYAPALGKVRARNVVCTVVCARPGAPNTVDSMKMLEGLGARIVTLPDDHGIRATLIDGGTGAARLFVATKKVVSGGDTPSGHYECKIYRAKSDEMLVKVTQRLYFEMARSARAGV